MAKGVSVRITGLDKLTRKLKATTKSSVIMEAMFVSGLFLAGWSKKHRLTGPRPKFLGVRTGRLRSSIATSKTLKRGSTFITKIGTNVTYGKTWELGEQGRKAKPFLKPALEDRQNHQEVVKILKRRLSISAERQM